MLRYRLYTERLSVSLIVELAARLLGGATIYRDAQGVWQRTIENSLIVETIVAEEVAPAIERQINKLAALINRFNDQQAVMITRESVKADFVTSR